MFNLLTVIELAPETPAKILIDLASKLAERGRSFSGVVSSQAGPTLPRDLNGGSLMWRVSFAKEPNYHAATRSTDWRDGIENEFIAVGARRLDEIPYQIEHRGVRAERKLDGIWRCLVLAVDPYTSGDAVRQFEADTLLMPGLVSTIGSWSLGRTLMPTGRRAWTHVWEQEFDDVAGLEGEYMTHPVHWGLVDGWFDPECPQRIVDPMLVHAAFSIREAVIL